MIYWRIILLLPLLVCLSGCAGYQMGVRSLYAPDIATVYVPMIESDSFRPYLGEWLTEAVVKEIEEKTPYKVVGSTGADSILSGRIVSVTKRVLVENAYDQPRDIEMLFAVQVQWIDRSGRPLRDTTTVALPAALVRFTQASALIPEAGQSIVTAEQEAIERLAEQIVATMEAPW